MRTSEIKRKTGETDICLSFVLDGSGRSKCESGVGFLDHMLSLFAKHGSFDLELKCQGDTYVDDHHSTEDIAICLGRAFAQALGDKKGIRRYGDITLPMDEALVLAAVDISGRGQCCYCLDIPTEKVGSFDTQLCEEFFCAFAREAGITIHLRQLSGKNSHHIIEAAFKALARCLDTASDIDPRNADALPSTKGVIG